MTSYTEAFQDIPGTTVFDIHRSRLGYHLNMFCMSLLKVENRESFKANERAYLESVPMTEEQRQAVMDRDYARMISLGGNIYFLGKLSAADGVAFGDMVASMTEGLKEDYARMMSVGGRSIEGNRSKSER
ncbi:MAG: protocatechuate 4,5-dioxygenase subunit alpha [Rhizobiales bacterium]|nr:protocatechuate 4,5-dioxygenase subunit alpha [Hyphomicrobiales bacterium]